MLRYFMRNRHGVISVMTALTLVAILSMSSAMSEIGRHRAVESAYKELANDAAYSTLSHYDDDLYERFALMAMTQETDKEVFLDYLMTNLNAKNSDAAPIDKTLVQGEDIEFEKMYDLQTMKVLKAQILEASKYRAPARAINDLTNFEDMIKELLEAFESALPILEFLNKALELLNNFLDMLIAVKKFSDTSDAYKDAHEDYKDALDAYNKAIKARDKYIDKHSDDDDYAEKLPDYLDAVKQAASDLSDKATKAKECTANYETAIKDLQEAYANFAGGALKAVLEQELEYIKNEENGYDKMSQQQRDNMKTWVKSMKKDIGDADTIIENIMKDVQKLQDADFEGACDDYQEQIDALAPIINDGSQGAEMTAADSVLGGFWTLLGFALETIELLADIYEQLNNLDETLKAMIKMMEMMCDVNLGFSPQYNNYITDMTSLPSWNASNPSYSFDASDKSYIDKAYKHADDVLGSSVPSATSDLNDFTITFASHSKEVYDNFLAMQECMNEVGSGNILQKLIALAKLIVKMVEFIASLITFIGKMISYPIEQLTRAMYSYYNVAVYATSMFPNRVSEPDDKNMLGKKWEKYSDYWAPDGIKGMTTVTTDNFSWARAEYVVVGSPSEVLNQQVVHVAIFLTRMILNIPALLTDTKIMDELVKVGVEFPIGTIAAIVVAILLIALETQIDMIFLICGGDTVPLVKISGLYITDPENLADTILEIVKIIDEDWVPEDSNKELAEKLAGFVDDLKDFGWDYEGYLILCMVYPGMPTAVGDLLFDAKVRRIADLIQMEMVQTKKAKHAAKPFKLNEMYTTLRVKSEAEFQPLLPIPSVPTANGTKIKINNISYAHY